MGALDDLRGLFADRSAAARVADDPDTMAELLLLVRTVFADGELMGAERQAFDRVLASSFGIGSADVPAVLKHLAAFGYETTPAQAAGTFAHASRERREALLRHMAQIARADSELHPREVELLARTGETLGFDAAETASLIAPSAAADGTES